MINNDNRTEWSPIRSVIIRVINKIGRPLSGSQICFIIRVINKIGRSLSGSQICFITSMVTDRIGRIEVLLPINHNSKKLGKKSQRLTFWCINRGQQLSFEIYLITARANDAYCPIKPGLMRKLSNYTRHDAYIVLLMLKSWLLIAYQIMLCYVKNSKTLFFPQQNIKVLHICCKLSS